MSQIKALLDQISQRISAVGVAAFASATAALLAYFRLEAAAAIDWLLAPVVRHLPWHQTNPPKDAVSQDFTSELTLVDVYLMTPDGAVARYKKTTSFVVTKGPISTYREAVTASGQARGFSTEIGIVIQTTIEHGFYLSRIDLGTSFSAGSRFRNIYGAELIDCVGLVFAPLVTPAMAKSSCSLTSSVSISCTTGRPSVRVPVLSSTTWVTVRKP